MELALRHVVTFSFAAESLHLLKLNHETLYVKSEFSMHQELSIEYVYGRGKTEVIQKDLLLLIVVFKIDGNGRGKG